MTHTKESAGRHVGKAAGMVSVQAECSHAEAMLLLRRRSRECGAPLADVAAAVVDRRIRFGPAPS